MSVEAISWALNLAPVPADRGRPRRLHGVDGPGADIEVHRNCLAPMMVVVGSASDREAVQLVRLRIRAGGGVTH